MNSPSPIDEIDLSARREAAHVLAEQGHVLEAERAFSALLRDAPDDSDALNFLATCAHGRGRADEALALLDRAHAVHPQDATTLTNLGILYREQNRLDEARHALSHAMQLAPDFFTTRLRLGEVLQALGRTAEALPVYFGAIMTAQARGRWRSDATTEPALRPLVRHAIGFIELGRRKLFGALLNPLRERHGAAALARVEKCLATYLGEMPAQYPDPAQRPSFLYFPDLPTTRFLERELFPWYADLEAGSAEIRQELLHVLAEDQGFEPFFGHVEDQKRLHSSLSGEAGTEAWNTFFFYRHGRRNDDNARRCPQTAALLDAAPLCRVRDHGPEACFSVLMPGSRILPHRGVTNTRVVTHLALIVPEDCALAVSGQTQTWQEGTCFTFDDTFEHEAWNRSAEIRVVMLMDTWNPWLTEIERIALTELIGAIGDFNRAAGV
jgi:aspartate beta-hydroxylase